MALAIAGACHVLPATALAAPDEPSHPVPAGAARPAGAGERACDRWRGSPWPTDLLSRRALIAELQAIRPACMDNAPYLGLLGALLLEEGDAAQALIWLERSLLLEPGNLGAQADLALTLAELGQPEALRDIISAWQGRTDLPPALRDKLRAAQARSSYALPVVRLGQPSAPHWGVTGEVSLLGGHEDNLDRSPRLTELTLTIPDGAFVLPVSSQPRKGAAVIGTASVQMAYAPQPATVLRTGWSVNGRKTGSQSETDWHQFQWVANASQRWNGVRAQLELGAAWFGGPLGEPYRMDRWALSADTALAACRLSLAVEGERRSQSTTTSLDARSHGAVASLQCPLFAGSDWNWALAWREGRDRPASELRPGGDQTLGAQGLRVAGSLPWGTRVEASLRTSTVDDSTGYSALLENNAVRRLRLVQYSLELSHPLPSRRDGRWEAVLQWQAARQTSNLPLFNYRADSLYAGLRWSW